MGSASLLWPGQADHIGAPYSLKWGMQWPPPSCGGVSWTLMGGNSAF